MEADTNTATAIGQFIVSDATTALSGLLPTKELDDDVIDLDDTWTQPYDAYLFHVAVKRRLEDSAKSAEVFPAYKKWREGCLASLRGILEHHFPDRWELKCDNNTFDDNPDVQGLFIDANKMFDLRIGEVLYTATIHFPRIDIANSRNERWTIKDFYIFLELDYKLSLLSIKGYRATKTVVEFNKRYGHSHMESSSNNKGEFCFGSTSLDTLVVDLRYTKFDEMKMELLLQNLPDYLSWESIEGNPYISIGTLLNGENGDAPAIPSSTFSTISSNFISTRPKIDYDILSSKEGDVLVQVRNSLPLWKQLSAVVPEQYMFPADTLRFRSVYTSEVTMSDEEIEIINSSSQPVFTFKGVPVKLKIEKDVEKKENRNVEKFADDRILSNMTLRLNGLLGQHIYKSFWNGTKIRTAKKD